MNVSDYMKQMKRGSKKDDIPGVKFNELDEECPTGCGRKLKEYAACCGSPQGYKGCSCGYRIG